jgi:hypothetical protein
MTKAGTQATTAAALAVAGSTVAKRLPLFIPNATADAMLKAALGVGAMLAAMAVKNDTGKAALIGLGVGVAHGALSKLYPVLG